LREILYKDEDGIKDLKYYEYNFNERNSKLEARKRAHREKKLSVTK
jgi:hypothetical protein